VWKASIFSRYKEFQRKNFKQRVRNFEESGICTLFVGLRNVSGEIEAVYRACECAQKLGAVHIKIFTDYIGCKELVYGNWKPKNYVNLRFVQLMRTLRISYVIENIKGHSGNELHNAVDRLARSATTITLSVF